MLTLWFSHAAYLLCSNNIQLSESQYNDIHSYFTAVLCFAYKLYCFTYLNISLLVLVSSPDPPSTLQGGSGNETILVLACLDNTYNDLWTWLTHNNTIDHIQIQLMYSQHQWKWREIMSPSPAPFSLEAMHEGAMLWSQYLQVQLHCGQATFRGTATLTQ